MRIERLGEGPIIHAGLADSIGTNIQGPSLIAAPPWLEAPLGRYYLYFADHKGDHIRLAYADDLAGPWQIHEPGALQLSHSGFPTEEPQVSEQVLHELHQAYERHFGSYSLEQTKEDALTPHIASPDVHLDLANEQIVMYFHGLERVGVQCTRVATSFDGVHFTAQPQVLGPPYFRVFEYDEWIYALAMPGQISRSRDGVSGFEEGPKLFAPVMRHSAVLRQDNILHVWWTRVGDAPEAILHSQIDLAGDWSTWSESEPALVLAPELSWEGAEHPLEPSRRGAINEPVNQLRDPAIFVEGDEVYLLYSGAGESCIGIAKVVDW